MIHSDECGKDLGYDEPCNCGADPAPQSVTPPDAARAIAKMMGKLDDEDKATFNWLVKGVRDLKPQPMSGDIWGEFKASHDMLLRSLTRAREDETVALDEAATLRARVAELTDQVRQQNADMAGEKASWQRVYDLDVGRLKGRVAELEASRRAYASEFPPGADGEPDVGSIHENIRRLKAERATLNARLLAAVQSVPTSAGKE